jgi:hypothetical protein
MEHTCSCASPQSAKHYQEQAIKLRQMAEKESTPVLREQLLGLAAQYQELADILKVSEQPG